MRLKSFSLLDTVRFGRALGEAVAPGECIGLDGDLGAGKTHFVQAIAAGLRVPAETRVTSPTFTLVNIYRGGRMPLVHADLYRLESASEVVELGLDDWIGEDALVCVEWAARFDALPADTLGLRLEVCGDTERTIHAVAPGDQSRALLERWLASASMAD